MVDCIGKEYKLQCKVAPVVGQGLPVARHAERLAWRSTAQQVRVHDPRFILQHGEVAVQWRVGVVVLEYGTREWFDLGEGQRRPAQRLEGYAGGFDAGADREVLHFFTVLVVQCVTSIGWPVSKDLHCLSCPMYPRVTT